MNKLFKRIRSVNKQEFDDLSYRSSSAELFLTGPQFAFMRDYINESLDGIKADILNNKIVDVTEEVTISDRIKKLFFTPKKVQEDELIGAYKWINKFLADMNQIIEARKDIEDRVAKGEVVLEDGL